MLQGVGEQFVSQPPFRARVRDVKQVWLGDRDASPALRYGYDSSLG